MVTTQILTIPKCWYVSGLWGRSAGECLKRLVQLKQICITKRISSSQKITSWYILIYWLPDILERNYSIGLDVAITETHLSFKSNVKLSKNIKVTNIIGTEQKSGIKTNDKLNVKTTPLAKKEQRHHAKQIKYFFLVWHW